MAAPASDRRRVAELLGRQPDGEFDVVVRDEVGDPVVIRNAPLLPDGRPMPTRYWLVGRRQLHAVSRLESSGGVRAAEAAVDAAELEDAHRRYATERDAVVPADAVHRPSGGVGGTRRGVKCLHAHYAWHLAGGDDPVGRWVAAELATIRLVAEPERAELGLGADVFRLDTTTERLTVELAGSDPPAPEDLTNAVGAAFDEIDDLVRTHPELLDARRLGASGSEAWQLAVVELGAVPTGDHRVERDDLEALFRALATESRAERVHNPGLAADRVDAVLATCCLVVGVLRRLQFQAVTFTAGNAAASEDCS